MFTMIKTVPFLTISRLPLYSAINYKDCHYDISYEDKNSDIFTGGIKQTNIYARESWYTRIKLKNGQTYQQFLNNPDYSIPVLCPESCPLSDMANDCSNSCYSPYPEHEESGTLDPKPVEIEKWFKENVKDYKNWFKGSTGQRLSCCCGDCFNYDDNSATNDKDENGKIPQNRCKNSENIDDRLKRCKDSRTNWENDATHEFYHVCATQTELCKEPSINERLTEEEKTECKRWDDNANRGQEFSIATIVGSVLLGVLVLGGLFLLGYYCVKSRGFTPGLQEEEELR